jgi:hypothetical protein
VARDPVTHLKITAKMRMDRAEQKVAAIRLELSRPSPGASRAALDRILAGRIAEAEEARRAYENLARQPDWQLAEQLAREPH